MIKTHDTGQAPFTLTVTPQVNELCNLRALLSLAREGVTAHLNGAEVLDRKDFKTARDERSLHAVVPGATIELPDLFAIERQVQT